MSSTLPGRLQLLPTYLHSTASTPANPARDPQTIHLGRRYSIQLCWYETLVNDKPMDVITATGIVSGMEITKPHLHVRQERALLECLSELVWRESIGLVPEWLKESSRAVTTIRDERNFKGLEIRPRHDALPCLIVGAKLTERKNSDGQRQWLGVTQTGSSWPYAGKNPAEALSLVLDRRRSKR